VLDFLNTRTGPPAGHPDDDLLTDYAALLVWFAHAGFLAGDDVRALRRAARKDPRGAEATFELALAVRDRVAAVFGMIVGGGRPRPQDLAWLRDAEAEALAHATLAEEQGFSWTWAHDRSVQRPVRPIVHSAVELLTRGPLDRIKQCAGCSYLFLDESKNRSRRWCSMDDCGASEKARRYVAARRLRGSDREA